MTTTDRELPAPDLLTEAQLSGAECVWCAVALSGPTALDLGMRPHPDGLSHWFPRACPNCHPEQTA
ncbi:hypothetical protein [Streptomyces sp. SCSIO ZS0520]|uniref:hypothetical protein n=1 Tax=Streptomyces sp. SCSIO ZS0520 TaxID=2892996 RepID=UPI0021DAECD0|nr:hypothetical protein [Streptomyces sp. SCSIO ZS0520]